MAGKVRSGLDRMRTHINRRMSANQQPHELYMKLTSLEIERSRRVTERDATENRLRIIAERVGEIESEQNEIKAKLNLLNDGGQTAAMPAKHSVQNRQLQY